MTRTIGLAAAALLALCSAGEAATAAKGMTLTQLKALVDGLGYESSTDGTIYVSIGDQGKSKSTIYFQLMGDAGATLYMYVPFSNIEDDKRAALPGMALLKANSDTGPYTYSITLAEGKERVELDGYFDTASLTKQSLRRDIDGLVAAVDAGEPLWDQSNWTAAAGPAPSAPAPATLDAARAAYQALWDKAPLTAQNAMFVTQSVSLYGAYAKRPTDSFKQGETIYTYLEPKGYAWKPVDGGSYNINVVGDLALVQGGNIVFEKKGMIAQSMTSHDKIQDLYFDLKLTTDGMPPGEYTLRYTLHDINSGKTAEVTLPFKALP